MRLDNLVGGEFEDLAYDFEGFDIALVGNLMNTDILGLRLGFGGEDLDDTEQLLMGGWQNDALFGGLGDEYLESLMAGDIYALLIPESVLSFGLGSQTLSMFFDYTENGGVYATPVPAAVWLLASGLLGLVGIKRRFG